MAARAGAFYFVVFLLLAADLALSVQARPGCFHEEGVADEVDRWLGDLLLQEMKNGGARSADGFTRYTLDGIKKSGPSPGDNN
ncbi:hypothetical protein MUK42_24203 [Musa troglodytarum]|uniref:Uncharacterized protein n=1 Tax=Musa troglodytarum TaxID=320322 RepID=A0A9E7K049_9LILI|nr:hypothetical protein MUK42_24203 [Musa troglodytarum]